MKRLGFGLAAVLMAAVLASSGAGLAQTAPATGPGGNVVAPATPTKVAVIKLSNTLLEKPAGFSFSLFSGMGGGAKQPALSDLIVKLNKAAKDVSLGGVLIDLKSFDLTLSQAQELGQLLQKVRDSKKRVVVFAPDFDTATYIVASHADTVIMPENGDVLVPGVGMGIMFYKGLLDNVHVQADMIQVGKFKGAEEPFTRTVASPEFKAQIDGLADAMYGQIVKTIADNRKLDEKEVKAAIDIGWMSGKQAKKLGLVDQVMDRNAVNAWYAGQFAGGWDQVEDYGEKKKKAVDMDNPFAIFQILGSTKASTRTSQAAIAVIYADGTITGDVPEGSMDDESNVTPALIRKAVDAALKDDLVKSIVLRVDSPGGSASASDEIWQILKEADKKKPITVSMGRVAASGGYYISCGGRSITADPATITGSIGVVGGKIVVKGLMDWAGLSVQTFERGKHAGILSAQRPFTEEERTFVRNQMTEIYDQFTSRVKAARGDKVPKVEDVAQGRLFDGYAAQKAGLVDNVGTLGDTITAAAKEAKIERSYQIIVYPEPKTFADVLREGFSMDARMPLEFSAALKAMPASYRKEALKALTMIQTMREEKVLLAMPAGITEK